jgi:hypothetical protein
VLAAPDELSLGWLCDDAAAAGFLVVRFHEPDLDGALTAAALEPAAARLVSRLPLAFSRGEEVRNMTTSTTGAAELRAELVELAAERDALRAQLDGDLPAATRWLQRKVWRQAAALDALNRRVVTQRFVLRALDGLGRSLTAAEYRAARARVTNAQLRDRIDDPDAA